MNKFKLLLIALTLCVGNANSSPILDEETVKAISVEMAEAVKNNDISVFEKYLYPGSDLTIDTDPANNRGEKKISYDEYMKLTKMGLSMMSNAEIHEELLSISIDKVRNEATIEEKTTSIVEMMGMKMEDVSVNKTTYGIVDGQIKVLVLKDQSISTGLVK